MTIVDHRVSRYRRVIPITLSDAVDIPSGVPDAMLCMGKTADGTPGQIIIFPEGADTSNPADLVVIPWLAAGTILPFGAIRIIATGSDAVSMFALYR